MCAGPPNALGIDIGGTHTRLGIVEPSGRVVEFREHPTPDAGDPSELSELIKHTIETWSLTHELGNAVVGVALPGVWDRATTVMQRALNLPRLDDVRLDELFEHATGRSVYLETDVIAAGWAQHRALDPSPPRFVYLSIGTGVGGCVILDGQIVRHTRGGAGHFGHLIVDTSPHAPLCWDLALVLPMLLDVGTLALVANQSPVLATARKASHDDQGREVGNAVVVAQAVQDGDGLTVQGRLSLPVGHVEGQKVPAMFWTYPREYEEPEGYEHAAVRGRNRNAFTHMSWLRWSDIWLTQGYALVYPDIPIIGENYNDTYISNLVDAMYGAIRAVDGLGVIDIDRIGHGGHSYGAFATANILANSPYFKAGIAGDGAYNRSLTPAGFQSERRSIWEAPQTYIEMSPFFKADQINVPLLMYHGGDDNNTGTFPIQSERMIQALTTLGKEAVLYVYPYESHTPRAIENKLDMWARFIGWFDQHAKNPKSGTPISQ